LRRPTGSVKISKGTDGHFDRIDCDSDPLTTNTFPYGIKGIISPHTSDTGPPQFITDSLYTAYSHVDIPVFVNESSFFIQFKPKNQYKLDYIVCGVIDQGFVGV
jgi:hypothetical protein